jgi:hypothetical protein
MQSPTISQSEYDQRKLFLEDLKTLTKDEYEEIFRILRRNNVEYSENSNGVFFDLLSINHTTFESLQNFMQLSKTQRTNEKLRTTEMNILREETTKTA